MMLRRDQREFAETEAGRVRPSAGAVVEPVQGSMAGEVVERADVTADGDAPVAQSTSSKCMVRIIFGRAA
ncbi:hypothetical protein ABZ616_31055 [Streptomyces noursei]|uniref:hypothetical protein n=1 Tax=Streptomyces noursei TaxID=1971 RepID=UPI0033F1BB9F